MLIYIFHQYAWVLSITYQGYTLDLQSSLSLLIPLITHGPYFFQEPNCYFAAKVTSHSLSLGAIHQGVWVKRGSTVVTIITKTDAKTSYATTYNN